CVFEDFGIPGIDVEYDRTVTPSLCRQFCGERGQDGGTERIIEVANEVGIGSNFSASHKTLETLATRFKRAGIFSMFCWAMSFSSRENSTPMTWLKAYSAASSAKGRVFSAKRCRSGHTSTPRRAALRKSNSNQR